MLLNPLKQLNQFELLQLYISSIKGITLALENFSELDIDPTQFNEILAEYVNCLFMIRESKVIDI